MVCITDELTPLVAVTLLCQLGKHSEREQLGVVSASLQKSEENRTSTKICGSRCGVGELHHVYGVPVFRKESELSWPVGKAP